VRGDYAAARRAYEGAIDLFVSLDPFRQYTPQAVLHGVGFASLGTGDVRRATDLFLKSADLYRALSVDRRGFAECVIGLACTAVRAGEFALAARLFGSAEAALEGLAAGLGRANQADYERGLAGLARGAPASAMDAERAVGRTLELEQALDQARAQVVLPSTTPSPPAQQLDQLTPREREVASLLAQGKRNREIADALVITPKTAANHVQRVLDKLGTRSRAEVAARALELGLRPDSARTG
jgi:DNA-binding CsgD family transcriptional regulator